MGIRKHFEFNGKSSLDYGLYITGSSTYNFTSKSIEKMSVPGRNGDLLVSNDRYENQTYTLTVGFFDTSNFHEKARNIRNWLMSADGYCRLEDDYHPDEYRMAVYTGGADISVTDLVHGEFELSFDCKPQHFLKSGEIKQTFTTTGDIKGSENQIYLAEPLVRIYGTGTLTIGLGTITVLKAGTSYIDIDCAECYAYEDYNNRNENISVSFNSQEHAFPKIGAESKHIAFPSTITKVEVTPRWWLL